MSMTLTAPVDATATSLPVSEAPPDWWAPPSWGYLPIASPAPRSLPFEIVRLLAFEAGLLTVERACELYDPAPIYSPPSNRDHLGASHAAGQEVAIGLPIEHLAVSGGRPLGPWVTAKAENRRLARQERRYREPIA